MYLIEEQPYENKSHKHTNTHTHPYISFAITFSDLPLGQNAQTNTTTHMCIWLIHLIHYAELCTLLTSTCIQKHTYIPATKPLSVPRSRNRDGAQQAIATRANTQRARAEVVVENHPKQIDHTRKHAHTHEQTHTHTHISTRTHI